MSVKNKIIEETVETIIDSIYEKTEYYMLENGYDVSKMDSEFFEDREEYMIEVIKELNNRIKTIPPNTLKGTVNMIIVGWIKLLKLAAITKKAVSNAKANIINNSLLVSFNSSDCPFHAIWLLVSVSNKVCSKYFIASERV